MYFLDEKAVEDTTEKDVTIKEKGWSLEYAIKVQEEYDHRMESRRRFDRYLDSLVALDLAKKVKK